MGNPCAPPVAILFLDSLEQRSLQNRIAKPDLLLRYIYDYGGIWIHREESLQEFLSYLNSLHPTVKFTMEYTKPDSGVPYLDTLVSVVSTGARTYLTTELYIKPTNSGIVLHFSWLIPHRHKLAWLGTSSDQGILNRPRQRIFYHHIYKRTCQDHGTLQQVNVRTRHGFHRFYCNLIYKER